MIKNVFCSWLWTSNGEQVLEEKMNFNEKNREKYNQCRFQVQTSWVMDFPSAKFTMTQMMVCLTFPRMTFFYYSPLESCIEQRTCSWDICSADIFLSIYDCNHEKYRQRIKCSWLWITYLVSLFTQYSSSLQAKL